MKIRDRIRRRIGIWNNKFTNEREKRKLRRKGFKNQQKIPLIKKRICDKIDSKEKIQVGFIGYQDGANCDVFTSLYNAFKNDLRFQVTVIIAPYTHDSKEEMIRMHRQAEKYLERLKIPYLKGYDELQDEYLNYKNKLDIAFFQVDYTWMRREFKAENFPDALTFLLPYGQYLADNIVDSHFSNPMMYDIYKIFPTSKSVYKLMCKASYIGSKNISKFLGNPKLDVFFDSTYIAKDVWKKQDCRKKRIVWAPHHLWSDYSNFIEYSQYMLETAQKYSDYIQIAFKPHPALSASLAEKAGWSKKKINDYYHKWEELPNAQYEDDGWIDLFCTSDAMILDSIGFMAEYSLTRKPACVIYRENSNKKREKQFSICGEEVFKRLYHAKNQNEIEYFIEKIVINENDEKKEERINYIMEQYLPPLTGSASKNIYNYVCNELKLSCKTNFQPNC